MAEVVYVATPGNFDVANTSDVTIVSTDVSTAVGDQLYVDGEFTLDHQTGATPSYTVTLDFDALGDVEIGFATFDNGVHTLYFRGILDIRASNLCYMVWTLEHGASVSQASGADPTSSASTTRGMGWATSTSDVSGTTTVALLARSTTATATQTLRLHRLVIRRMPVPAGAASAVPYRQPMIQLLAQ